MPRIAVLLPCRNEESTVGAVVRGFRNALGPDVSVYVYDNDSQDGTAANAAAAGAILRHEPSRGKGNVVRRMFADVDADIYVMADGDQTYDPADAPRLVAMLLDRHLDMAVATRVLEPPSGSAAAPAFPRGHRFGNREITRAIRLLFGPGCTDALSGYRAFSRRFVKSFPASTSGFEIETELTIHALDLGLPCAEMPSAYAPRPSGSHSKLRRMPDGLRIAWAILNLLRHNRPLMFFGSLGAMLAALAVALALPLFVTYAHTGLVPRLPTAVLCTGLMLLAFQSLAAGFILDTLVRARREAKRLAYLALPRLQDRVAP
ncbi:MAG: glycosyltransferase [Alphaproteobacteria bacterium]